MDEARIKALFRGHAQTPSGVLDECSTQDIMALLDGQAGLLDEDSPLDRVATSPLAADIARVVVELAPDCEALAVDLRRARAPVTTRVQRFARRGFALAAGCGVLALLFAMQRVPPGVPTAPVPTLQASDIISTVSFEEADAPVAPQAAHASDAIFGGNFDS